MIAIRPARIGEAEALTALCLRSKAHWGYDEAFMRASTPSLTITAERIADGRVLVAEDEGGNLLGIATADPLPAKGDFDLAHLFVDAHAIGRHVGEKLLRAIVALIRSEGATRLMIESDPNAKGFYERLGAEQIGQVPSASIPGRMLPLLALALNGE